MSTTTAVQQLPLFQPITAKSEERITQMYEEIKRLYQPLPVLFQRAIDHGTSELPTPQNDVRLICYAFLVARNWNVKEAVQMAQEAIRFIEKFRLGDLSMFPSGYSIRGYDEAKVASLLGAPWGSTNSELYRCMSTMASLSMTGFHYWDRRGLPVAYWLAGRVQTHTMLKKAKAQLPVGTTVEDYFQLFGGGVVETGWYLCAYQDTVLASNPQPGIDMGAPRRNFCTVVVDCKGLNYKMIDRPLLEKVKATLQQMNCVFADFIHRVLVVNCPPMVKFAYTLLKSALTEGIQQKLTFLAPENSVAALDAIIGLERVPSFMGGRCNCPGGCLPCYNPNASLSSEEVVGEGDLVTEDIKLGAGTKHEKVFELAQGEEVIWEFSTTKGTDVRFWVMFYPKQAGISTDVKKGRMRVKIDKSVRRTTAENPVVKQEKLKDGADSFMAPEDGILQLVWDNSRAMVHDKSIQMRVYKSDPILEVAE
ncbi:hypothetical protein ABB37_01172 [Leptomonas pyrrhocoris]|uniref:CRAL-TRIO domain-containing protein n=1 Tax=Leptomonas pyrrhocoris TaxID=157538 RepID=A0A0N0VGY6_LEPPY|nr:hypothetical protein ABB37_01172 [Leptomonas pyrrhocoris]KPA84658.1 hypothetical protein ABB37_01172 [Leptomonas pyrrhocoris]|eukprot:XP_015663097.1 hypothetical protein ABB37_01172 [Leptomonas pyrrhocoris]